MKYPANIPVSSIRAPRPRTSALAAAAMILAFAPCVMAQHTDALLALDADGKLVTGQILFELAEVQNLNTFVYEDEFDGPFGNVWTTDGPGFNAVSGSSDGLPDGYAPLPGSTSITFDAKAMTIGGGTSNFWYWDGLDAVDFAPVSTATNGTVLEISKSPTVVFSSLVDGSATDVAGFEIDTTGSDGFLHKHIDFTVSNTDGSAPATGFYLWSLAISAGTEIESDPIFMVHGLGIDDEAAHEAAVTFVEATFGTNTLLSADFNLDGSVDLLDLDILGSNWQQSGTAATGDANGDGTVDLLDLDLLGGQWQQSSSFAEALDASGITIPEPASLGLAGIGILVMGRRRR